MNIGLAVLELIVVFSLVVLSDKLFKKEGLFAWASIALIIANLIVGKTIDFFGFTGSLGNIAFASIFLAADIISEKYGKKEAKRAIYLSVFSCASFVAITQISLLFIPRANDTLQEPMKQLLSINIRTSIASIVMFFVSNIVNIHLYNFLKKKFPKQLWLRNNVATILCNCLENYLFVGLAFAFIFPVMTILSIATFKTVLEIIISVCSTPFLYAATKKFKKSKDDKIEEVAKEKK